VHRVCGICASLTEKFRLFRAVFSSALLGRRQAVRQRILIPPCGGSNPPAPATHVFVFAYVLVFGCRIRTSNVRSLQSPRRQITPVSARKSHARELVTSSANSLDSSKRQNRFDTLKFESLHASHAFPDFGPDCGLCAKARISGGYARGCALQRLWKVQNRRLWRAILAPVSGRHFPMSGISESRLAETGSIRAETGSFCRAVARPEHGLADPLRVVRNRFGGRLFQRKPNICSCADQRWGRA
jgi:hypothetical protein